jgi:hypothetical protein
MAPEGRDLLQGKQNEGAPVHLRMRQQQLTPPSSPAGPAYLPAAEIEDINVELARPPMAAKPPAGPAFDAFEGPEQCGRGD